MEIEIIKHSDISYRNIIRAIKIKNEAWNYTIESHLKWIHDNLNDKDIHVFLKGKDSDLAYLNLVSVKCVINKTEIHFLGIGNVCSKIKNKGYGLDLMNFVNEYLLRTNQHGILFCKDSVLPFYLKAGWKTANVIIEKHNHLQYNVNALVYNLETKDYIIYNDRDF